MPLLSKKMIIRIAWLYPELMSTYGDRGNVIFLQKRGEWRGINIRIEEINKLKQFKNWDDIDLIFGGGAQDRQQEIVREDVKNGIRFLKNLLDRGVPGLFVCGSFQLLGHYYEMANGKVIEGLGLIDIATQKAPAGEGRLTGNFLGKIEGIKEPAVGGRMLVGFENHGGRTYLGSNVQCLARVVRGFGNNGKDGCEGAVYKNWLATYLHGPVLPKNSYLADWLIKTALEVKYGKKVDLERLDDSLEERVNQEGL